MEIWFAVQAVLIALLAGITLVILLRCRANDARVLALMEEIRGGLTAALSRSSPTRSSGPGGRALPTSGPDVTDGDAMGQTGAPSRPVVDREVELAREGGAARVVSPLRGAGADAVVQEIRAQGDRIVDAIGEASAAQKASREATASTMLQTGAGFLRGALDEATPRTLVVEPGGPDRPRVVTLAPPVANDADEDE